jgi:putative transposase
VRRPGQLSVEQAAAAAMVAEAKARGLALTGPDGLLTLFTKNVLETALNEEVVEHLGHEKNQAEAGRESTNVRNGTRSKTVISDAAGEVQINVPRDREACSNRRSCASGNAGSPRWTRLCCRCMRRV